MKAEDIRNSFDQLRFSSDFRERTVRRLNAAASERKEPQMKNRKLSKKGRVVLLAAVLAVIFTVSAGAAAARFLLPQKAQEFISLTDLRLYDSLEKGSILTENFDVENVTEVKTAVKTNGHTVAFEGIVEGQRTKYPYEALYAAMQNHTVPDPATAYVVDERYAVLTVSADDGGPVLGVTDDIDLHHKLGAFVFIQGIDPVVHSYVGQFIEDENVVYFFVPIKEVEKYADRELRICVFENWAPDHNIFGMGSDGLPFFRLGYDGLRASFVLDLDDSLADHEAVKAEQDLLPLLPTRWEVSHGMAY